MYTYREKHPQHWTKHASFALQKATDMYMVQLVAESHC